MKRDTRMQACEPARLRRPGDHPEFFRFPAPEGRSRESTIRLDAEGRFFHDGALVEHAGLAAALHSWIDRHPDDGRYILTNGYDWTYFTVDDAPYTVRSLRENEGTLALVLSDGSEEAWDIRRTRVGDGGALYATVKPDTRGGPFEAKFTRHAQTALAPYLVAEEHSGRPAVSVRGKVTRIGG
jgi:hypothetical protein